MATVRGHAWLATFVREGSPGRPSWSAAERTPGKGKKRSAKAPAKPRRTPAVHTAASAA